MIQHNELAIQIQHTSTTRANLKVSFLNREELEEGTRQHLTVDIRILSNKKKSLHPTARIKGFPVKLVKTFARKLRTSYQAKSSQTISALVLSARSKRRFGPFLIAT